MYYVSVWEREREMCVLGECVREMGMCVLQSGSVKGKGNIYMK